jgi:hypothetical protein
MEDRGECDRGAMVDTDTRPLVLQVYPASVQDRDGAVPPLKASRPSFPFVQQAFADTAYAGQRVAVAPPSLQAAGSLRWLIAIPQRVVPRRRRGANCASI